MNSEKVFLGKLSAGANHWQLLRVDLDKYTCPILKSTVASASPFGSTRVQGWQLCIIFRFLRARVCVVDSDEAHASSFNPVPFDEPNHHLTKVNMSTPHLTNAALNGLAFQTNAQALRFVRNAARTDRVQVKSTQRNEGRTVLECRFPLCLFKVSVRLEQDRLWHLEVLHEEHR